MSWRGGKGGKETRQWLCVGDRVVNKGGNASSFSNQAEITGGRGREEKNKRAEYCDMSGFFFSLSARRGAGMGRAGLCQRDAGSSGRGAEEGEGAWPHEPRCGRCKSKPQPDARSSTWKLPQERTPRLSACPVIRYYPSHADRSSRVATRPWHKKKCVGKQSAKGQRRRS